MRLLLFSLLGLVFASAGIIFFMNVGLNGEKQQEISVNGIMSKEASGFRKADSVRKFVFPEDYFAHHDFQTEWWYLTGNIFTKSGRRFGYQFTIFRNGILPGLDKDSSLFSINSLYSVHIGISDLQKGKFYSYENFARGMKGRAESNETERRILIDGNEIRFSFLSDVLLPQIEVNSSFEEIDFQFTLNPEKQPVLHGDRGLSAKSDKPGNASYYYSFTRLQTKGKLRIGNESFEVSGFSWMDREWSTGALDKEQKGWDWFAIQIQDGTELMYFRLRDAQGKTLFQKGTLVNKDGTYKDLSGGDLKLTPLATTNLRGTEYPSKWKIQLLNEGINYEISIAIQDQEHQFELKYYEGAIDVVLNNDSGTKQGNGYVELTGYNY